MSAYGSIVLEAIRDGADTIVRIEEATGLTKSAVRTTLDSLYVARKVERKLDRKHGAPTIWTLTAQQKAP